MVGVIETTKMDQPMFAHDIGVSLVLVGDFGGEHPHINKQGVYHSGVNIRDEAEEARGKHRTVGSPQRKPSGKSLAKLTW